MTGNIDKMPLQAGPIKIDKLVIESVNKTPEIMRGNRFVDIFWSPIDSLVFGKAYGASISKAQDKGSAITSGSDALAKKIADKSQAINEIEYAMCHLNFLLSQQ